MKANKLTYLLVGALAMTMAATGCKKKTTPLTPLPDYARTPGIRTPGPTDLGPGGAMKPDDFGNVPMNSDFTDIESKYNLDPTTLAANTVHFDFDSSVVKSSERGNVDAVAAYMKSAPRGVALLIAGHCDERGTEEYNRSLGERRAQALRDALIADGADGSRIATRSYGEDQPVDPGHNEVAWAKNRRGVFIVLTPK